MIVDDSILPRLPVAILRNGWTAKVFLGADREGVDRIEATTQGWLWNDDGSWRDGSNGPHSMGREHDMDIVRIMQGNLIIFEI